MTIEGFLIGFALFCWFILCGLLVFVWYWILFDEQPTPKKIIKETLSVPQDNVPAPKLRFKKPSNLNI